MLVLAQTSRTVTGEIRDSKKAPLQGASVLLKGTTRGVSTDAEGRFVLSDVPDNGTLVLSSTGFTTMEVPVKGKTSISLNMAEAITNLNEVVVVGYGTRQKRDVTGAVAQVKVTQLENENPQSVQDALRGNVPGLNISQINAGSAKGGGDLQVRGRSSLSAGTSPLIVLDGIFFLHRFDLICNHFSISGITSIDRFNI